MPIRNTSLEYAARVPRYSERTTMHAPTRGLFNKTLPLRTQRTSHNTASAMRGCPKECLLKKYCP